MAVGPLISVSSPVQSHLSLQSDPPASFMGFRTEDSYGFNIQCHNMLFARPHP